MVARAKPLPPRFSHDAPLPIDSLVRPSPGHFRWQHRPRQTASRSQARRGHQAGAEKRAQRSRRQRGHGSTSRARPGRQAGQSSRTARSTTTFESAGAKSNARQWPARGDERRPHLAHHRGRGHLRRRRAQRGARSLGLRAPLRAHDVRGQRQRAQGRALQAGLRPRRQPQRDDVERSHQLLRDAARRASCRSRCGSKPIG